MKKRERNEIFVYIHSVVTSLHHREQIDERSLVCFFDLLAKPIPP